VPIDHLTARLDLAQLGRVVYDKKVGQHQFLEGGGPTRDVFVLVPDTPPDTQVRITKHLAGLGLKSQYDHPGDVSGHCTSQTSCLFVDSRMHPTLGLTLRIYAPGEVYTDQYPPGHDLFRTQVPAGQAGVSVVVD